MNRVFFESNRYSFVWKTAVIKNQAKLGEKITEELPQLLDKAGVDIDVSKQITVQQLKKIRKKLYAKKQEQKMEFVNGKGHRKSGLQRAIETINGWLERLKRYNHNIHFCG